MEKNTAQKLRALMHALRRSIKAVFKIILDIERELDGEER